MQMLFAQGKGIVWRVIAAEDISTFSKANACAGRFGGWMGGLEEATSANGLRAS